MTRTSIRLSKNRPFASATVHDTPGADLPASEELDVTMEEFVDLS